MSIGSYRVDKNRPVVRRRLPDIPIQHAYANTISHNMELSQLRDQNEHLGQIIKSLTDRVDDLTQMVTRFSPAVPVDNIVEEESLDKTAQLVAQLQSLTDRVSKKQRTRAPAQQIIDQMSVPGDNDTDVVCLRQYMRPTKFDGSSPFETFLAYFKNCAEHNHWTDTEKLSWLKGCLIKNAGQVLWDSTPESIDTFDKLVDVLCNRFGGTKQTDKHRMELRYRRRHQNETLTDLHQDISRLMALAHPHLSSSSREVIACDYFIDSLNDSNFALKVRERNPSSLDEALRISLQLEA